MPPAVPPSSQPPPTPNASHFLLFRRPDRSAAALTPARSRSDAVAPAGWAAGEMQTPTQTQTQTQARTPVTGRSSQARPTPLFAPSWAAQQSQNTLAAAARPDDEIDEGSSPPPGPPLQVWGPGSLLKPPGAEATEATATTTVATTANPNPNPNPTTGQPQPAPLTQFTPFASRTPWQPRWQSARRPRLQEDIEDAEDSDSECDRRSDRGFDSDSDSGMDGDSVGRDRRGLLAESQDVVAENGGHGSGSEERGRTAAAVADRPHREPLRSAGRPYKRRRLFVSPDKARPLSLFSEPGEAGQKRRGGGGWQRLLVDDIDEGNDDGDEDDDDDDGYDDDYRGGNRRMSYDEIRDILEDSELLEGWKPPDENGDDDYDAEEEDFAILDASPSRKKTAARKAQQQQPGFQRARLFLTAGNHQKSSATAAEEDAGGAGEEAKDDGDGDGEGDNDYDGNNGNDGSTSADQRQPQVHQHPPPDFFSPRKRQRKRGHQKPQAAAARGKSGGQFMAGGLAAELRDWLVQIKVQARSSTWTSGSISDRPLRYAVIEARLSSGMCLVLGRPEGTAAAAAADDDESEATALTLPLPRRLLLAGEGRWAIPRPLSASAGEAAMLASGRVVAIAPPSWGVNIGGNTWTVASNWAVE